MAKPLIQRLGPETYQQFVDRIAAAPDELTSAQLARDLSEEFGERIGVSTVKQYRRGDTVPVEAELQGEETTIDESEKSIVVESYQGKFRSTDEALADAKIDTEKWEVERQVVNYWQMGSKLDTGRIAVTDLYQIKIWLKPKVALSVEELRDNIVADIAAIAAEPAPRLRPPDRGDGQLGVLVLNDAHLGSLVWAKETLGDNYDVKIAAGLLKDVAMELLARARDRGVRKIIIPVGNDLIHWDHGGRGYASTFGGTPLTTDGRFQRVVRYAYYSMIEIARAARDFAEVEFISVPGNHDTERSWFVTEILGATFADDPRVTVTNNSSLFSYYEYGVNFLGFTHGTHATTNRKRADLAQTMIEDRPESAKAKCRMWFLGHLHHERELVSYTQTAEAFRSVVVRNTPAIAATDGWHKEMNFQGAPRGGELHYFHETHGRLGYDTHFIGGYDAR